MKRILITIFSISTLFTGTGLSNTLRTWTQKETGKTLQGVMGSKSLDGEKVLVYLPTGKSVWLKTAQLTDEDTDYAKKWIQRREYFVIESSVPYKQEKDLKIRVRPGPTGGQMIISSLNGEGKKMSILFKPEQNKTVEVRVPSRYRLQFHVDEKLVDEKTWHDKRGEKFKWLVNTGNEDDPSIEIIPEEE